MVYDYKIGKSSQQFAGGSFCCSVSFSKLPLAALTVDAARLSTISTSIAWTDYLSAQSSHEPRLYSTHVTRNKKGDDPYEIPFETLLKYGHPLSESVPRASLVDVPEDLSRSDTNIETIREAFEIYLDAHRRKFSSKEGLARKTRRLSRFGSYLEVTGHSMRLADLTTEDGEGFMDTLANAQHDSNLSLHNRKRIRGALRSFSRFAAAADLIEEDLFFDLRFK